MMSDMAPSLVVGTSRVYEGAMFRQLTTTPPPKWRKSSLEARPRSGHFEGEGPRGVWQPGVGGGARRRPPQIRGRPCGAPRVASGGQEGRQEGDEGPGDDHG